MNLKEIIGDGAAIMAVLSIFIEISPIKFNPLSQLLRWFGHKINAETLERVEALDKKIINVESMCKRKNESDDRKDAIDRRIRILQFGDELRRDVKHSKESFDQILDDISNYNNYCKIHPEFPNEKTVLTAQKIKEVYRHCMDYNDFL